VVRVGTYAAAIYREWAERRGVPALTVARWGQLLRRAAMQHDIGKAAVPPEILNKRGRLNDQEQRVMQTHCARGARLCAAQRTPWAQLGAEVALHHHQRWDGSGYPRQFGTAASMHGTQIPLSARIVGLADVYDALRTPRTYKSAWRETAVVAYLQAEAGTLFDPEVVAAFFGAYPGVRATASAASS
jgi:putative two-component system response regulator